MLGDVRDPGRLASTFAQARPELVFHAAALKHVHMVEANPNEGVLTNAVGTRNVADACIAAGTQTMVLVSTDKAVSPTSVMGATKRIAESYCQALADSPAAGGLRLVTVRFGNVIGSSGSVVPLFQRQIAEGGPVTVTDPDVSRYFMTTREAVQLLLQASALGAGEEGGGIYVLDMGKPIKVVDLARQMIRLAGRTPDKDIEIVFTGLRPGEKKDESLFHPAEPMVATETPGILRAQSRPAEIALMQRRLDQLAAAAQDRRTQDALALVAAMVPEYQPSDGAHSRRPGGHGTRSLAGNRAVPGSHPMPDIQGRPIARALISVSDKTGLEAFASALARQGVAILSTGGTARVLRDAGIAVTDVSEHTGFPEIMGGRVKTLHPAIHGGILGRRDDDDHRAAMEEHGIAGIDLVAVNLYPFEEAVRDAAPLDTCIETIDIGGPAMIRAAAKNHDDVTVVVQPSDYRAVIDDMEAHGRRHQPRPAPAPGGDGLRAHGRL